MVDIDKVIRTACFPCEKYNKYKGKDLCLHFLSEIDIQKIILCRQARERLGMWNRGTKKDNNFLEEVLDFQFNVKTLKDFSEHKEKYGDFLSKFLPEETCVCEDCAFFEIKNGKRICFGRYSSDEEMELENSLYRCADFLDKEYRK